MYILKFLNIILIFILHYSLVDTLAFILAKHSSKNINKINLYFICDFFIFLLFIIIFNNFNLIFKLLILQIFYHLYIQDFI